MPNGAGYPVGPGAGPGVGVGGVPGGDIPFMERIQRGMGGPGIKQAGAYMFGAWLLDKLLQTHHERGMRGIQKASLRSQAEMITPESLYFQAAQPQAQAEETMARQALMTQLTGGVLGPQLAKGEYVIGG